MIQHGRKMTKYRQTLLKSNKYIKYTVKSSKTEFV